ncbi:unnamed protein product, partial [Dovyalis caffra]
MKMITRNWEKQEDDYNFFLSLKKIQNQSKSMKSLSHRSQHRAPHTNLSPPSSSSTPPRKMR